MIGFCYPSVILLLIASIIYVVASLRRHGASAGYQLHRFDAADTQPLRGIMALLIVMTHVSFKYPEADVSWGFTSFGAPIVSTFFFLSGYGLVVQYERKGRSYLDGFIRRSMSKILPPFVWASLIWIFVSCIFMDGDLAEDLIGFVVFRPPLPYSWFVYALILFYIAFYLVFRYVRQNNALRQVVLLTFTLAMTIAFRMLKFDVYWYISLFAFNIGAMYGGYKDIVNNIFREHTVGVLIVLIVLLGGMMIFNIRTGLLAVIPLGIVTPVLIMGSGSRYRLLSGLGKVSYEIYLAHGIVVPMLSSYELSWSVYIILAETMSLMLAIFISRITSMCFDSMLLRRIYI